MSGKLKRNNKKAGEYNDPAQETLDLLTAGDPKANGDLNNPVSFFTAREVGNASNSVFFVLAPAIAGEDHSFTAVEKVATAPAAALEGSPALVADFQSQPKPNVEFRPGVPVNSNYFPGRNGNQIVAICDHIMEGSLDSTDEWFKNPASQVSAHFGIGTDGRIFQWVDTKDMAYANGLGYDNLGRPIIQDSQGNIVHEQVDTSVSWLRDALQRRINPNYLTISIEHAGHSGDVLTPAQYQATLALHAYLISTFKIPPDRDHIVGHYQVAHITRPACPGFDLDKLVADLEKIFNSINVQPANYTVSIPGVATVRQGPRRSFPVIVNKEPGPDRQFQVTGEAHGEPIWDDKRNRWDDVWVYIPDLDGVTGFVTRTAVKLPGE